MKTILVTGTSSGIGARIARRLAERGDVCLGVSRRRPEGVGDDRWLACDLADPEAVRTAGAALRETLSGPLSGVVLNAACGRFGPALDDMDALEAVFRTNVFGHMGLVRELRGQMPPGTPLVCVSTSASRIPAPMLGPYAASKAALEQLVLSMALEEGWRASILRPAEVDTGFAACCGVPPEFDSGVDRLDPDQVARRIIERLDRPRHFVNLGRRARLVDLAVRAWPSLFMRRGGRKG